MAGVTPTKTSVQLRLAEGLVSIPAADHSSAGVMSAAQAKLLDDLAQAASGGHLLIETAAPDMSGYVRRQELAAVVQRIAAAEQKPARSIQQVIEPSDPEMKRTVEAAAQAALDASDQVNALNLRVIQYEADNIRLQAEIEAMKETLRNYASIMAQLSEQRMAAA